MTQHPARIPLLAIGLIVAISNSWAHEEPHRSGKDATVAAASVLKPLPALPPPAPEHYRAGNRRSPFAAWGDASSTRQRDPLEQWPLEQLQLQGILTSGQRNHALIKAPDQIVYPVSVGHHLGQQNGRIERITPTGITLTEAPSSPTEPTRSSRQLTLRP